MAIKIINNYLDSYLDERQFIVAPATLRSEKSKANNIKKVIGKRAVDSVLHSDLRQLILRWHRRFSNKTINGHLTILRAIFERAMRDGIIERNPMTGIENLKNVKNDPNPFTKSDLTLMFECNNVCEQGKNAALFDALTGLRISELIAASWDDVDWQRNVLYIRRARVLDDYKVPKTSASVRAVDLNPLAVDILKKQLVITGKRRRKTIDVLQRDNKTTQKESVAFIFINSKTRQPYLNAKQFGKAFFTSFLETAGIAHRGAGQLRHTFASQCLTAGVNKEWISQQMGHTGTHMIDMHYGKWLREDAPDCALLASQHLQDAFGMPEIKRTVSLPAVSDAASNMLSRLAKKPQLMQLIQAMLEDA